MNNVYVIIQVSIDGEASALAVYKTRAEARDRLSEIRYDPALSDYQFNDSESDVDYLQYSDGGDAGSYFIEKAPFES